MTRTPWSWREETELPAELMDRLHRAFQIGLFEAALGGAEAAPGANLAATPARQDGGDAPVEVLAALADLYSEDDRPQKSLELDMRLVAICPGEAIFHFNLACSHSLLGNIGAGLEALARALQLGYDNLHKVRTDTDLENLRQDRRYTELLGRWNGASRSDRERQGEADAGPKGTQLQE